MKDFSLGSVTNSIKSALYGEKEPPTELEQVTGAKIEDLFVEDGGDIKYNEKSTKNLQGLYEKAMDIEPAEGPETDMEAIREMNDIFANTGDRVKIERNLGIPVSQIEISMDKEGPNSWRDQTKTDSFSSELDSTISMSNVERLDFNLDEAQSVYDSAMSEVRETEFFNDQQAIMEGARQSYNFFNGLESTLNDYVGEGITGIDFLNNEGEEQMRVPGTTPGAMYGFIESIGFGEDMPQGAELGAAAAVVDKYFDSVRMAEALREESTLSTEEAMERFAQGIEPEISNYSLSEEGLRYMKEKLDDMGLGTEDYIEP